MISIDNITTRKSISVEELQEESNLIMYISLIVDSIEDNNDMSSASALETHPTQPTQPTGKTGGEVSASV